jgi:RNA polymerase sigma-70 factor (ECF subfamily)
VREEIAELVERFKAGDERAFDELLRRYEKRIYAHAYYMLGDHDEADEILQETFVRVIKNLSRLRADANFTSFVFTIATNLCIDAIRRRQKKGVSVHDEEFEQFSRLQLELSRAIKTPEEEQETKEIVALIKKAIADLPPKQRATIVLHDIEGYSKEEISRMMNCPIATVRSNLFIARHKVKSKVSGLMG